MWAEAQKILQAHKQCLRFQEQLTSLDEAKCSVECKMGETESTSQIAVKALEQTVAELREENVALSELAECKEQAVLADLEKNSQVEPKLW